MTAANDWTESEQYGIDLFETWVKHKEAFTSDTEAARQDLGNIINELYGVAVDQLNWSDELESQSFTDRPPERWMFKANAERITKQLQPEDDKPFPVELWMQDHAANTAELLYSHWIGVQTYLDTERPLAFDPEASRALAFALMAFQHEQPMLSDWLEVLACRTRWEDQWQRFLRATEVVEYTELLNKTDDQIDLETPVFAAGDAKIPERYRDSTKAPIGPLNGPAALLARAITGRPKARKEDLLKKHESRVVFVIQVSDRKFEVYFQSAEALSKARTARDKLLTTSNDV